MAAIKSFTDLEQSRVLAKILPLESADMYYGYGKDQPEFLPISDVDIKCLSLPCWSLASLLDILPNHFYDKTGRKTLGMDKGDTYYNIFYENKNSYIQKRADNPVDACVAMIEKLNELNLL